MTRWKVLSKASLLLACLLCYSAYNPATAQDAILVDPGIDILIQDEPPLLSPPLLSPPPDQLIPPSEPVLAPTYSPNNPFANSEYKDIADIAEDWLQLGGNIDEYFYSEGFTTGTDGTLGNEHLCIRDDFNKVYVGRSDVCVSVSISIVAGYITSNILIYSLIDSAISSLIDCAIVSTVDSTIVGIVSSLINRTSINIGIVVGISIICAAT